MRIITVKEAEDNLEEFVELLEKGIEKEIFIRCENGRLCKMTPFDEKED